MGQEIVNQATDVVTCMAATSMGWPEAFATVGVAFAFAFIMYCIFK